MLTCALIVLGFFCFFTGGAANSYDVIGAGASIPNEFYQVLDVSYQLSVKHQLTLYTPYGSAVGLCVLMEDFSLYSTCQYSKDVQPQNLDYAGIDFPPDDDVYQKHPDLKLFPTLAAGVVPIYNLPLPSGQALTLSLRTLANIFSARITHWRHPSILHDNPTLDADIPDANITVCVRADWSGTTYIFKEALGLFEKSFHDSVPMNAAPIWMNSNGVDIAVPSNFVVRDGNEASAGYIINTPNSIGYSVFSTANSLARGGLALIPKLKREDHTVVEASYDAIQAATDEQASVFMKNADSSPTLIKTFGNAKGENSWPIVGLSYIAMRTNTLHPGRTCKNRNSTVTFWNNFYVSLATNSMVADKGFAYLPDSMRKYVTNIFQTSIHCHNRTVMVVTPPASIIVVGPGAMSPFFSIAISHYAAHRQGVEVTFDCTHSYDTKDPAIVYSNVTQSQISITPHKPMQYNVLSLPFVAMQYVFISNLCTPELPHECVVNKSLVVSSSLVGRVFGGKEDVYWDDQELVELNLGMKLVHEKIVAFVPSKTDQVETLTAYAQVSIPDFSIGVTLVKDDMEALSRVLGNTYFMSIVSRAYGSYGGTSLNMAVVRVGDRTIDSSESHVEACVRSWNKPDCYPLTHVFYLSLVQNAPVCTSPEAPKEAAWFVRFLFDESMTSVLHDDNEDGLFPITYVNTSIPLQLNTLTCSDQCILCASPNTHSISPTHRIMSYIFACFILSLCLFLSSWLLMFRQLPMLQHAQPMYLIMSVFGCALTVSSVFFMSVEPEYDEQTGQVLSTENASVACVVQVWMYCLGFMMTFSSLFAKMWRVRKIFYLTKGTMTRLSVKATDVLPVVFAGLLIHIALLTLWELRFPIHYETLVIAEDDFGRVTESKGACTSQHAIVMLVVFVVIDVTTLALGNWLCYSCRDIPTQFAEGKWISYAMFSWFQSFALTAPLISLLRDEPSVTFALKWLVAVFQSFAVLIFVFGPKLWLWWSKFARSSVSSKARASYDFSSLERRILSTEDGSTTGFGVMS